jgi:flavorubredoxin
MNAIEICKDVHWVGAIDWALRDFHGYSTEQGSTYNAFLVRGEKTALIDTVKVELVDQLLLNLREVIDPANIDIIVSNHAEMDHSGALPQLIELCCPEHLVCSPDGRKALSAHYHQEDWPFHEVKAGDTLALGGKTLRFLPSKMLHWPDSMVSYLEEDRVLFSNDIFGQHLASSQRFDDQVEQGELLWQVAKYFANIFWPTAAGMKKFLQKLPGNGIDPALIAPDHGVLWRTDPALVRSLYESWSAGETRPKVALIYSSMWESTADMAHAISRGLGSQDIEVKLLDLRKNHRSDAATDVLEARAVVMGSPVFNGGLLPEVHDFLAYLKGLKPKGKLGAAFGSYGWANVGVKQLNAALEEMKIEVADEGVSVQYRPDADTLEACEAMGARLRERVLTSASALI